MSVLMKLILGDCLICMAIFPKRHRIVNMRLDPIYAGRAADIIIHHMMSVSRQANIRFHIITNHLTMELGFLFPSSDAIRKVSLPIVFKDLKIVWI